MQTKSFHATILVACLASLLLPVYAFFVLYPDFNHLHLKQTEAEAIRIAQHLTKEISRYPALQFSPTTLPPLLQRHTQRIAEEFKLWKLRLYTPSGLIIYSTVASEYHQNNTWPYFATLVKEARVWSKTVQKNRRSQEQEQVHQSVTETYIPVLINGNVVAVLEIYIDITAREKQWQAMALKNGITITGVALFLLMLLAWTTRQAIFFLKQVKIETDERRQTEAILSKQSRYLDNILRSATGLGIAATDLKTTIKYFNPEMGRLFNAIPAKMIGQKITAINQEEKNKLPPFKTILRAVRNSGVYTFPFVRELNGQPCHMEVKVTSIHDHQQKIDGFLVLVRDITQARQAQLEKEALTAKLHDAQKMEAIGRVAGNVAHDLNNILSGLVTYPELLLLDLPSDSPQRPLIETIKESGQQAATVVADLLTIARRGSALIKKERQVLNTLVNDYLASPDFKGLQIKWPDITLKTVLSPAPLALQGSAVHLTQCLKNLIVNSIEATAGQGEITIRTTSRYLDSPLRGQDKITPGEYLVLSVEDNGTSIPEADVEHIFAPFYTKKKKKQGSGSGLGLTLVANTVHDHHGYLTLQSMPQETCFSLYFPVDPHIPPAPPPNDKVVTNTKTNALTALQGHQETILIIDDEAAQRTLVTNLLQHLNYQVKSAKSGEESLEQLKTAPADLLILDMMMPPGMNGRQTYEHILQQYPQQKAIICSGFSESEDVKKTLALGAHCYIKKPYTIQELGQAIKAALITT